MIKEISKNRWAIIFTFLIALIFDILPIPSWAVWLRPHWTLLVLIYWMIALPYAIGIAWAFVIGIVLDLLLGSILGEHAFAMVITAYIVFKLHQRFRLFSLFQQTLIVSATVLLYNIIILMINGLLGTLPNLLLYWGSILTCAILWPGIFILLRDCQARFEVV